MISFFFDNYHKVQLASLLADKAPTILLLKYSKFANIFSLKSVAKVFKYIGINNYAINLVEDQQLLYKPIYCLESIELELLKIYIKINLAKSFICSFKSSVDTPILFV